MTDTFKRRMARIYSVRKGDHPAYWVVHIKTMAFSIFMVSIAAERLVRATAIPRLVDRFVSKFGGWFAYGPVTPLPETNIATTEESKDSPPDHSNNMGVWLDDKLLARHIGDVWIEGPDGRGKWFCKWEKTKDPDPSSHHEVLNKPT